MLSEYDLVEIEKRALRLSNIALWHGTHSGDLQLRTDATVADVNTLVAEVRTLTKLLAAANLGWA